MPPIGRGRHTDPDVRARIIYLARLGWTPGGIQEMLRQDPELATRAPSKRTIEAIAGPIRRQNRRDPQNREGAWSFASSGSDEARALLPVLRWAIEQSRGKILAFDADEARWIYRILAAAPGIPAGTAFLRGVAIASVERDSGPLGEAEQALQMFLAFQPWEDLGAAYVNARWDRWIPDAEQPQALDPLFDPSAMTALNSRLIVEAGTLLEAVE